MFYFGGVHAWVVRSMSVLGLCILLCGSTVLLGLVDHEDARPYFTKALKDYQYERLNPNTTHQRASATAIAIGGWTGTGWRKGDFAGRGWLPYPYTDSVFPAFAEEFGLLGIGGLFALYYTLLYFGFQVATIAKDHFGRLLAAGITIYLAMHILVNLGMMCGFLPITGVPLVLVTYGGSSILVTMASLGILQSIYSRRFMF
jgi:rod shape determining protein RodA